MLVRQRCLHSHRVVTAVLTTALLGGTTALPKAGHAQQTISWTTWTADTSNSATGSILTGGGTVGISYSGEVLTSQTELNGVGTNHWLPTSSFTGTGSAPGNAPPGGNMIALIGGSNTPNTITFSTAVTNPYVAVWSVGQGGSPITYNFNAPLIVVAGGPSQEFGGSSITSPSSNVLSGAEGNGVVVFQGTFTSLSFTVPNAESFHGFTVGVAGIAPPSAAPEPSALAFLLPTLPLLGMGIARRRRA